ncbi:glycosyltransferase family 4 protein [Halodesulfovibrio sp.]|jgi:glycosyltransferase involved in cell wall biosynthesis|uniref:glycosyltransferase family 4 protein n=1 Tax=Halodesulfovibrio sp. TaxID=1912772 RepID=UPI0025DEA186|nr:glycosyltransferase family 4 protein [Halodesulfovibrio sp.]MCT4535548.1 glycosyltransferase family 4 protein [Halodesulfovibrio sp.]
MKLLHLNTYEKAGGAAIAANRRHQALLKLGVDSTLAVVGKETDDPTVHSFYGKIGKVLRPFTQAPDYILPRLYRGKDETLFSPALWPTFLHRKIAALPADIIQMEWIADSFLPASSIGKLNKPVVWTLQDAWGLTGGCHILKGCEGYKAECGNCPQLSSRRSTDLSRIAWRAKKRAYAKCKPVIVTPSKRMCRLAKESSLLCDCTVKHIPNGIDEQQFFPVQKEIARTLLQLPADANIVLFGAMSANSDKNKGYDLLLSALQHVKNSGVKNIHCVIFGATHGEPLPFPTHYLGTLHDPVSINLAYNAADVFVCPSREENFPNTVLESLSTGTPVAAFGIGGIPDIVSHTKTGYLAPAYDTEELAKGISFIMQDTVRLAEMGKVARTVIEEQYTIEIVAKRYLELYESILENRV